MNLPYSLPGAILRRHPFSCSATLPTPFPMVRTTTLKVVMGMVEGAGAASDREMNASSACLEWPSGHDADEALAHRFLAAGEAAFRWNTGGKERWAGRTISRSRRTYRELSCEDRRRRLGVSSAPFSSLSDAGEGRNGKQDKGSVSWTLLSDCLHILFWRDSSLRLRDSGPKHGGNLPFSARYRETLGVSHV